MKLSELKEIILELYGKKGWQNLKNLEEYKMYIATEEEQIKNLKGKSFFVKYLNNPSEKVLLEAVKEYPFIIEEINNPSEKVQLEAIKQSPFSIGEIHNPTEKVQLEAIKQDVNSIKNIKNPTDNVLKEALKRIDSIYGTVDKYKIIFRHLENDLNEEDKINEIE